MSEVPVPNGTPSGSTPDPGRPAAPLPPPRVPDHELIRRIGRGAYGEVWIARSVTGAFRAVKIVHRQSFDHDRPFEREFEGILKFEPISRRHDSQVDILHVGRGDDCFYYLMELADDQATGGQINPDHYTPRTLKSDLLFHGRLPFEECVRIGLALTTALENLHGNGLAHRDVKPSNIIFVNGVPKLADIGLVAAVEATRSYVGTEGFAAPEGPGSAQADLYSLGKVLYEISMGKDRQEFPELPTQLRELPDREGLMELNAVIAGACRHDPKDRYASATAMRTDLEWLQSGKSLARLHRTEAQLRFVRRAGAMVTVIAAIAAGLYLWQVKQTQKIRALAEENRMIAEEKTQLAHENRQRVVRLDIANGVRLLDGGDSSGALLWFADALARVANRPAEEAIHRIRIQQVLDPMPRLLNNVGGSNPVTASAWSPDGKHIALATYTQKPGHREWRTELREAADGRAIWTAELGNSEWIGQLRFTRDGHQLQVNSSRAQGLGVHGFSLVNRATVLAADTGQEVYPHFTRDFACTAFSPDDQWLVLAETNHLIRVRHAQDGREVTTLNGHTQRVTMLAFNASGSLLASASEDRTVRLWHLPSGKAAGPPLQHDAPVQRAVLSDDGSRLLTYSESADPSSNGGSIQMWNTRTTERVGDPLEKRGGRPILFFCPSSENRFVFESKATEIQISQWGLLPPVVGMIKMKSGSRCWVFSSDGNLLAVGSDDGRAYVWNLALGRPCCEPLVHNGWVESVAFSPDGRRLLTTSDDGTAKVWEFPQNAQAASLSLSATHPDLGAEQHRPYGLTPGPLSVALADGALHLVEPDTLTEIRTLTPQPARGSNAVWAAGSTGRFWALADPVEDVRSPQRIALWTKTNGSFQSLDLPHPQSVGFLQFNEVDSRLATWGRDGVVRFWRTRDGNLERSIPLPTSLVESPPDLVPQPFRPDCQALLLGYGDRTNQSFQLFDLMAGTPQSTPFVPTESIRFINRLRFSPDGSRLASVGEDQNGTIINLRTGQLAAPPFKHGGSLLDLDWSPDGKRLLTAGAAPEVKLWDAATGEILFSPMGIGTGPARAARWSADGRFIVTRGSGGFVRVWDAATAEAVTPLLTHLGNVRWACITLGNRLITASDPNLLRAWDLKPTPLAADVIADYAKLLSGRRLNAGGVLLPLKANELEELNRSLRARAPQLFE